MIDYTDCIIEKVVVHRVGSKASGEKLQLSKSAPVIDERMKSLLLKYFLHPFIDAEYFSFTSSGGDAKQNPLYGFAARVFEEVKVFHKTSVSIAEQLYEASEHSQAKAGDLFVAYFSGIRNDDEEVDAIGIFKSESLQPFLSVKAGARDFELLYAEGINIEKPDKGCLVLNTHQHDGFKVCLLDRTGRGGEAQWKDFLSLKPCDDSYHATKQFMDIAKTFVSKQLTEEFEVTRAEQIDLLNRSVDYFKSNETFDKRTFEKQVFAEPEVIESFRKFDEVYSNQHDINSVETFAISPHAVKKNLKVFKSVLKLDKNFHIYIHGDKNLIEKGFDRDKGMNFYKVYFKDEK